MEIKMEKPHVIWLNPTVLKWAREWRQHSIEDAARYLRKRPEQIEAWEAGLAAPTVKQARKLAQFYGRSFSELFLPAPPEVPKPTAIPDFRRHRDTVLQEKEAWVLRDIQLWAESTRLNALDLYRELGDGPPADFEAVSATVASSPNGSAEDARRVLGLSIQQQTGQTKTEARSFPQLLRSLMEASGILVLKHPDLAHLKVRGICIADFPLPVIVFTNESPTAQAFTLAHELGHVVLRQSAVSGLRAESYNEQPVEKWCDRFAAAFLMPVDEVRAVAGLSPTTPAPSIESAVLDSLANHFRVSPHAMLIRLIHLGYVKDDFYWNQMQSQFEAQESDFKAGGRADYYGSRYRGRHGDLYTGLVLEAWGTGQITGHSASEYLGIKNPRHLYDIRDRFTVS